MIEDPSKETYKDWPKIIEGQATVLFPSENEVFYNPVQQFNRDMSIAAIQTWLIQLNEQKKEKYIKKFGEEEKENFIPYKPKLFEALAATGLRSIRYHKEIEGIGNILVNDLEPQAVEAIKRNLKFNKINEEDVTPNLGDAIDVLYAHRNPTKRFDCIDLDPYGSASPFIDGAIQAIADGGILCVTCTDLAVLASTQHTEACFAKYGGVPVKAGFCHEMALRLVIHSLQTSASRYKRLVTPILSCSIDFYVRIFFRVTTSPAMVKQYASKTSVLYKCSGCGSFEHNPIGKLTPNGKNIKFGVNQGPNVSPNCEHCGFKMHIGGPMYNGPLHDKEFVSKMLTFVKENNAKFHTHKRMEGMLTVIYEELDLPLLYIPSELAAICRAQTPNIVTIRSAILNAGYKVSASHCVPGSFKTNAPNEVLWEVIRAWVKLNPVKLANFPAGAPGLRILDKENKLQISFEKHDEADPISRNIKLVRYQVNPEKNWGPKARHKRKTEIEVKEENVKMVEKEV
ncbi:N2,N2-dimethylguanosine tRNA methyltransferase [Neoconidiobolus thromboides FSU 785]|nr:N2,N2-dimethylguanosine tRNA methyltransferase [Neoconidiobolus thromboides FSU 785]